MNTVAKNMDKGFLIRHSGKFSQMAQ